MTRLELIVRFADGGARVERCERDDAFGRRAIDLAAFEALARPGVASVHVTRGTRVASSGGRGRYR